ncbi:MAG: LysE family transporter [Pseudomonadota bacterium]
MNIDPLYLFVFAGLFSPGPNVILLTTSGARFGIQRTLPHICGVVLGVGVIAGVAATGLAALLLSFPVLSFGLKVVAAAWILWMAVSLAKSGASGPVEGHRARPFTFVEAVLFQWINVKLWAIVVSAAVGYPSGLPVWQEALRLAGTFSGLNLFVCIFWCCTGSLLAYLLATPRAWRVFMLIMAAVLAASAVMVFL